jgi:hypothetical protein
VSTAPVSPLALVGDPTAAVCEGDFCTVPEVRERAAAPEVKEQASVASEVDPEASGS